MRAGYRSGRDRLSGGALYVRPTTSHTKVRDPDYRHHQRSSGRDHSRRERTPRERPRAGQPRADDLRQLGVLPDIVEALAEVNIVHPFPIQHDGDPDRADRHRHDRPSAHRHRQDARLRDHRPAAHRRARRAGLRAAGQARRPAGAGRHAHPRAGPAGQQGPQHGVEASARPAC